MRNTQWRDTPHRYGTISRALHWTMAWLFAWQFVGMACKLIFGRNEVVKFFVGTHAPVGLVLLALLIVRAAWGFHNLRRRPPYEAGTLGRFAQLGHVALYGLMLAVPVLALLRQYGSGRAFEPFGVAVMAATDWKIEPLITLGDALHGELGWLLLAVVAGHVGMVVVHRFVWRDDVAARMIGRRRVADEV